MKKQILLTIAAMLLPMGMMAQGYHMVQKDGLEYICKDGDAETDANLFIYVGGYKYWTTTGDETGTRILVTDLEGNDVEIENNRYFHHGTFRSQMRSKYNSTAPDPQLFAKENLDAVTSLEFKWKIIDDYKGVEYFRGITSLWIQSNGNPPADPIPYGADIDLSKNTNLTSLTFDRTRIGKLNISGTKITSLTIPTTSSGTLRELIMNDNEDLTSLTFEGTTAFSELKALDLTHTGITTFTGQYLTALETLTAQNSALTSLDISDCTGLVTLDVSGSSSLTTLTVASSNQDKLEEINVSGTGLTSLDLSKYIELEEVTITTGQFGSGTPPANITLPTAGGQSWSKQFVHGTTETWVNVAGIHTLTVDVSDQANKDVDLSAYTSLHTLTLIGAESVVLPSTSNTTNHFTLTMTDCADATIDWNGRETILTELTLRDVETFDGSTFTNLVTLRHLGSQSENLTLSSANTALLTLDITHGGHSALDLSGGKAPNLITVKTWYSAIELLDLSGHASLLSAPYPTTDNINPDNTQVYIKDNAYVPYSTVLADPTTWEPYKVSDPNEWIGLNMVPVTKGNVDLGGIYDTYNNSITTNAEIDAYNAGNKLKTVRLANCPALMNVYLTVGGDNSTDKSAPSYEDQWLYYNGIETVDVSNSGLTGLLCTNSLMTKLNVSGCTNLQSLCLNQGLLVGKAGSADVDGIYGLNDCTNLVDFIADRNKFSDLDFLLSTSNRSSADLKKIQRIHVNGGSYTLKDHELAPYVRENDDEPIKFTNRIGSIDLSNLQCWDGDDSHNGLRSLMIDCNLLKDLDLSNVGPGLQVLQCTYNMLATLDLTPLTASLKDGIFNMNASSWEYQVAYLGAEIVKGQWIDGAWKVFDTPEEEATESGKHDWVALHMEHDGGYTHHMDNGFGLYWNLYDARYDEEHGVDPTSSGSRAFAKESEPWMCRVSEIPTIVEKDLDGADKFNGDNPCPVGHTGQHIMLHSQSEIATDPAFGAFKDQDLTNCVLSYKYHTGFLKKKVANEVTDIFDSSNYSLAPYDNGTGDGQLNYDEVSSYYPTTDKKHTVQKGIVEIVEDEEVITGYEEYTEEELLDLGHIIVRVHLYPHLLNINPKSKSVMSVSKKGVNYFSGTIYLDYDAKIPKGVTCYTISGLADDVTTRVFEVAGQAVDGQLKMVPFGGEDDDEAEKNWILPAYTPVYVRAVSPQPAGLYAFETIHDVELLGWENVRGAYNQEDYTLHGIEKLNDSGSVNADYVDALAAAKARLQSGGKNAGNILRGYVASKHDERYGVDINDPDYNKTIPNNTLGGNPDCAHEGVHTEKEIVGKRTVLCLGVQNQKSTWPVIGFWPYNGTTLPSNRCYIKASDVYGTSTSSGSAKGFNFFFVGEEDILETTGINTVNNEDNQDVWYNMQGVRLNGCPTQHGVYIHNGQKVTIK